MGRLRPLFNMVGSWERVGRTQTGMQVCAGGNAE